MSSTGHKRGGYHGGHRPKLDPAVRRDVQLNVAVTHGEADALHAWAHEAQVPVSGLVHQVVVNALSGRNEAG